MRVEDEPLVCNLCGVTSNEGDWTRSFTWWCANCWLLDQLEEEQARLQSEVSVNRGYRDQQAALWNVLALIEKATTRGTARRRRRRR